MNTLQNILKSLRINDIDEYLINANSTFTLNDVELKTKVDITQIIKLISMLCEEKCFITLYVENGKTVDTSTFKEDNFIYEVYKMEDATYLKIENI